MNWRLTLGLSSLALFSVATACVMDVQNDPVSPEPPQTGDTKPETKPDAKPETKPTATAAKGDACSSSATCGEGSFCQTETCGGPGECAPKPELCTMDLNPVCGCDGKTYANACGAAAKGISVATKGACPLAEGAKCTALGQMGACKEGLYCEFDATCGGSGEGTCKKRPEVCTRELRPVCGCDGVSYGNPCSANAAGTSVSSSKECLKSPPSNSTTLGKLCGTRGVTTTCGGDEYCNYTSQCGRTDSGGTCTAKTQSCTGVQGRVKVCGCDGKLYDNRCAAAAAGVAIDDKLSASRGCK